jgi:hypothetical protein
MKAEFELSLDRNGKPCIKFKHHTRIDSLEQKLLKIFVDGVYKNGAVITSSGSYLECVLKIATIIMKYK